MEHQQVDKLQQQAEIHGLAANERADAEADEHTHDQKHASASGGQTAGQQHGDIVLIPHERFLLVVADIARRSGVVRQRQLPAVNGPDKFGLIGRGALLNVREKCLPVCVPHAADGPGVLAAERALHADRAVLRQRHGLDEIAVPGADPAADQPLRQGVRLLRRGAGAQEQQAQQMAAQQAAQQAVQQQAPQAEGWKCSCGNFVTGKFCPECGSPNPVEEEGWTCSCGSVNKGKFCQNCGAKKPEGALLYRCDKCGWEPEDPTHPPKFCPECGDIFDENDRQ